MQGTMLVNWLLVLVVVLATLHTCTGGKGSVVWSYENMEEWPTLFPDYCGGSSQSPVNIDRLKTPFGLYWPLQYNDYSAAPDEHTIVNNGHSVSVTSKYTTIPSLSGGGLWGKYMFHSFHFHWGSDGTQGSEHTIDGVRYPMELHIIHVKDKYYPDVGEAIKHADGLAVLGIMFKISTTNNPALAPLVAALSEIEEAETQVTKNNLYGLASLLPKDFKKFYRYTGSLTTPTCNEAVIWTVLQDTIEVSECQLGKFRQLKDSHGDPLENNYRSTQSLNKRKVYRSNRF